MITNNGTPLNLDACIKGCSVGKNIKVIALVDTCRELADVSTEHKGAAVKAPEVHKPGERYVIYTSEGGERALSSPEGSRGSNSWFKLFKSVSKTKHFTEALLSWEMKATGNAVIQDQMISHIEIL